MKRRTPDRREFLSDEGHRLALAEEQARQAAAARLWNVFRVTLCACSIPVCLLYLYACAYL